MSVLLKPKSNYTMIQNDLLNSTEISAPAKLLYIYLISKPDRWNFKITSIASQMKESKNTINRYLQELEDLRLLLRRKIVTKEGKFTGIIYYVANLGDSTISQKTVSPNLVNISNTDLSYIYETKASEELKPKVTLEQRKDKFKSKLIETVRSRQDINKQLANTFYKYWTEANEGGKKMRFEMEKVFDMSRRLDTFVRNEKNRSFKSKQDKPETVTQNS